MTLADIPALRLHFQYLTERNTPITAQTLVSAMGAIQAQDADMVKWAMGVRLRTITKTMVEEALQSGALVRTHVLRPTWHIVAAGDVRWMQALTGKHIKGSFASHEREHGIEAALYARVNDVIAKALEGGNHLTREEVMQVLEQHGIETNSSRAALFMMNAETDAIVCNGTPRGKELTYALLDEKVPPQSNVFTREESLSMLAERYFTSHAPATVQDFHWWSGLPMPDARLGLNSIAETLQSCEVEGKTYWMPKGISLKELSENTPNNVSKKKQANAALLLLPAFDEYCVSYKDRSAVFEPRFHGEAITSNGIFKPIIVANGRVVGIWKRTVRKNTIVIEPHFFDPKTAFQTEDLRGAVEAFGRFQEISTVIA